MKRFVTALALVAGLLITTVSATAPVKKTGYVYLGACDSSWGQWIKPNFNGLGVVGCSSTDAVHPVDDDITALKGIKVRAGTPLPYSDGESTHSYGVEIARLKQGKKVHLISVQCMCSADPRPGLHVFWGQIEWTP
jgi:hypothetical protein